MLYAIIDLDGTVADCAWRRPFAINARQAPHGTERRSALWEDFHSRCVSDPTHEIECLLVRLWAAAGHSVIYLTGRTDTYRRETVEWLERNGLPEGHLFMRPARSTAANTDYKARMYNHITTNILQGTDRIAFVMEDDDRVVALWRSMGLTCLQPRASSH